jgi:hypothetical protein
MRLYFIHYRHTKICKNTIFNPQLIPVYSHLTVASLYNVCHAHKNIEESYFMYLPTITDGRRVATYTIGPYIAIVLTDCESTGMIEYKHAVFVYLPDPHDDQVRPQVVMAVAAELTPLNLTSKQEDQAPAYFLGVFPGDGHRNMGLSTEWGDVNKFTKKAISVIQDHFKITQAPRKARDHADRND